MTLGTIIDLTLPVSDMVRSSAFYDQIMSFMSFKVTGRSKDGVTWKSPKGLRFTIQPQESPLTLVRLSFLADARHEVEELHDLLEGLGTPVSHPPQESPQDNDVVYVMSFEDPDGHVIRLAHIPAIDLQEDAPDLPELQTPEARSAHTWSRALVHKDLATLESLLAEDAVYSVQDTQGMILGKKNVLSQIQQEWEEFDDGMADFKARLGMMELGEEGGEEGHPCAIVSVNAKRRQVIVFSLTPEEQVKSVTVFTDKKLMKRARAF